MRAIAELDSVVTLSVVSAQVLGESRDVVLPVGTFGAVVLVHAVGNAAAAFEVESHLGGLSYALATVPAEQIASAAQET
ncbi:hypothetical protein M8A51_26195 [Schlegelella sp. S2-27]|uniref:Uncharacterized protein n=1 Tax=Caldimonas mangrovi TaxID=2944811 RepID=A0ABT0YWK7_9BURK|nr:hypothetical protein [Caldimonas mangrovi]MCM5683008.1 hypothetical protein [Caldimonas mangrovi]